MQVVSLSWNAKHRTRFLSASWDDTIKLWDWEQPRSLRTFSEHKYCVYAAIWCDAPAFRQPLQLAAEMHLRCTSRDVPQKLDETLSVS